MVDLDAFFDDLTQFVEYGPLVVAVAASIDQCRS